MAIISAESAVWCGVCLAKWAQIETLRERERERRGVSRSVTYSITTKVETDTVEKLSSATQTPPETPSPQRTKEGIGPEITNVSRARARLEKKK